MTSAGKELTSWLSACIVFSLCSLDCSFPVWCLGSTWNSIVSVPDHCPFIYFDFPEHTNKINHGKI